MITDRKIILTIAVIGAVLILGFTYQTRAIPITGSYAGYLILEDQKLSRDDYEILTARALSTRIKLPTENCDAYLTTCYYAFPEGVDANVDVNRDGKIDAADVAIAVKSFNCHTSEACGNEKIKDCYFTVAGRKFKDPTDDCFMNNTDMQIVTDNFGKSTAIDCIPSLDTADGRVCASDINKDGTVNMRDLGIAIFKNGQYADIISSTLKKNADVSSQVIGQPDGIVNMRDIVWIINSANWDQEAVQQKCETNALPRGSELNIDTGSKPGLYYVAVSYKCA